MKKFVTDFFRKFPFCTGLLLLLIALHLTGVKDLRTPMVAMPENLFLIFAFYACAMLFFALAYIAQNRTAKKRKTDMVGCCVECFCFNTRCKSFYFVKNPLAALSCCRGVLKNLYFIHELFGWPESLFEALW